MNPVEQTNPAVLNQIAEAVTKGMNGVIVLSSSATADTIAAGTSLYLGLTKFGKNVSIVAAKTPTSDLIGSDKIQTAFKTVGDNLTISFPYTEGAVDKVDYNIDGGTFNVIIFPAAGQPKLDPQKVQYSYSGGAADFIIVIDSPNLNVLGQIYTDNQREFQGKTIINIDRHLVNANFGTINYVDKTISSVSEMVLRVLLTLKCEIDKDIATNLYAGITAATNSFSSYSVKAETFEAAAALMKLGAMRKQMARPMMPMQPQQMQQGSQNTQRPPQQQFQNPQAIRRPARPPQQPNATMNQGFSQQQGEQAAPQSMPQSNDSQNSTPQDWLKPKIFRGGGGLV